MHATLTKLVQVAHAHSNYQLTLHDHNTITTPVYIPAKLRHMFLILFVVQRIEFLAN